MLVEPCSKSVTALRKTSVVTGDRGRDHQGQELDLAHHRICQECRANYFSGMDCAQGRMIHVALRSSFNDIVEHPLKIRVELPKVVPQAG
jgi:hypothetical protein